jgi:hypothetical protein
MNVWVVDDPGFHGPVAVCASKELAISEVKRDHVSDVPLPYEYDWHTGTIVDGQSSWEVTRVTYRTVGTETWYAIGKEIVQYEMTES